MPQHRISTIIVPCENIISWTVLYDYDSANLYFWVMSHLRMMVMYEYHGKVEKKMMFSLCQMSIVKRFLSSIPFRQHLRALDWPLAIQFNCCTIVIEGFQFQLNC